MIFSGFVQNNDVDSLSFSALFEKFWNTSKMDLGVITPLKMTISMYKFKMLKIFELFNEKGNLF